jgi:lipoprotein NlpD
MSRIKLLSGVALALLAAPLVSVAQSHEFRPGDTVFSLSRRYNVSVDAILEWNDIDDPTSIVVGTTIEIPTSYEVKPGDTLYGIARDYGTTVERIREINEKASDYLARTGDILLLPQDRTREPVAADGDETSQVSSSAGRDEQGSGDETEGPTATDDPRPGGLWPATGPVSRRDGKLPGVQISAPVGEEVRAVATGQVIHVAPYATFGRVVIVMSDEGYYYVYGGNAEVFVSLWDRVEPGSRIGTLARSTENGEGVAYFSVVKDDEWIDPADAPRI